MELELVYSYGCDQLNQTVLHFIVIIRVTPFVQPILVIIVTKWKLMPIISTYFKEQRI